MRGRALAQAARGSRCVFDRKRGLARGDRGLFIGRRLRPYHPSAATGSVPCECVLQAVLSLVRFMPLGSFEHPMHPAVSSGAVPSAQAAPVAANKAFELLDLQSGTCPDTRSTVPASSTVESTLDEPIAVRIRL